MVAIETELGDRIESEQPISLPPSEGGSDSDAKKLKSDLKKHADIVKKDSSTEIKSENYDELLKLDITPDMD